MKKLQYGIKGFSFILKLILDICRVDTKIGDLFSVPINDQEKSHFQLVAFDSTQLNMDVIRAFKKIYPIQDQLDINEIISDEV